MSSRRCPPPTASTPGNIDVPGLDTLQAALNRAVERHNTTRFTPAGHARDLAVTTLRQVIEALAGHDTTQAAGILAQAQPDSPGNTEPTVAVCIGVALGLPRRLADRS